MCVLVQVHSDSRHILAAIEIAKMAVTRNIPVIVDMEKPRPHYKGTERERERESERLRETERWRESERQSER